jgi:hypothetical protein
MIRETARRYIIEKNYLSVLLIFSIIFFLILSTWSIVTFPMQLKGGIINRMTILEDKISNLDNRYKYIDARMIEIVFMIVKTESMRGQ